MRLCELNTFHNKTERKKQEVTSKMIYLKVWKCTLPVEYRKYRKTEAWASLGVQFIGHASRLWWDGVCNICKFWSARTGIKEALWGGTFDWLAAELCKPVYWRGKWEKETERDKTGGEQLKDFRKFIKILNKRYLLFFENMYILKGIL